MISNKVSLRASCYSPAQGEKDYMRSKTTRELPSQKKKARKLKEAVDPLLSYTNGSAIRWRALSILGYGSEAQVIKAVNLSTGQIFAVKRLLHIKPDHAEIQILSSLRHRNVVKYLGSESVLNSSCLYLEHMPGGSLHSLLEKGPIPICTAKHYIRQMIRGLKYLHAQGVIHRDLKCANLLIGGNGLLKLSDFGCSKQIDLVSEHACTIKGSLAWTAPEVIGNNGYGFKADIWSLGCTVLEILTRKPPWAEVGDYVKVLMQLAYSDESPRISEMITEEARAFVCQCLQRDPNLRPSLEELARHPFLNEKLIQF